ncbi:MAG: hypothetical protein AAGD25_35415 [Cyanobacteria bacterium P01_F01_bin.150]
MQYNPIAFDSLQQNLLWSALTLQSANYDQQQFFEGADTIPPYFVTIAPVLSGDNAGKLFARISANIELDPSQALTDGPISLSAKPANSSDSVPSSFYQGLTLAGDGSSGGSVGLTLPFSDAESALLSEGIPSEGFWVLSVADAVDSSKSFSTTSSYGLMRSSVDGVVGLSPESYHGSDSRLALSVDTASSDTWTVFCVAALESKTDSYFYWVTGSGAYLGFSGDEIEIPGVSGAVSLPTDLDAKLHLYSVTFNSTSYAAYLDGNPLASGSRTSGAVSWHSVITNANGNWVVSDIVAIPREFSASDLNAAHAAFAASRPITVATI